MHKKFIACFSVSCVGYVQISVIESSFDQSFESSVYFFFQVYLEDDKDGPWDHQWFGCRQNSTGDSLVLEELPDQHVEEPDQRPAASNYQDCDTHTGHAQGLQGQKLRINSYQGEGIIMKTLRVSR